jgi:hypothetical protein
MPGMATRWLANCGSDHGHRLVHRPAGKSTVRLPRWLVDNGEIDNRKQFWQFPKDKRTAKITLMSPRRGALLIVTHPRRSG